MVKTGYISFITEIGGGYDADGNPVAAVKVNSVYVSCNLATVKKEYIFLVDGQIQQAKYSCYIDNDKVSSLDPVIDISTVKSIQLQDNRAYDLGIFQVQNVEYLELTKRIKLIV